MSGRYVSVIKNEALREKYLKATADPDVTDMKDDLALMRAMAELMVERCFPEGMENPQNMSVERIGAITDLINKVNRLVSQIVEREKALETYVKFDQVKGLIDRVVSVVQMHVHDPVVMRKIAKDLTSDKEFQDGLQALEGGALTQVAEVEV